MLARIPEGPSRAGMMTSTYSRTAGPEEAVLWKKKAPLLSWLDIELTERCNFDCVHCYINRPAGDRKARARELSAERIEAILKEAASLGCLKVRFTGGEPLLRGDFERLYLFGRHLGLKVILFTNASLLTKRLADLFRRIPPLEPIEVSVYGMTKAAYEKVTRLAGSFKTAWRGIGLLQERDIPFVVKGAYLKANQGDLDDFERWASGIPWMTGRPAYSQAFNLRCRKDSAKKNRLIKSLRMSPDEGLGLLTRAGKAFDREMTEFCSKFAGPTGSGLFSCGAGNGRGCIDAYGYFSPCLLLKSPGMTYDLDKGTLRDALTVFVPRIRALKAENPEYLARCARCFLRGLCSQCPARSWTENGTLDAPVEHLCQAAHAKARHLGLLAEGERAWEVRQWRRRLRRLATAEDRRTGGRTP